MSEFIPLYFGCLILWVSELLIWVSEFIPWVYSLNITQTNTMGGPGSDGPLVKIETHQVYSPSRLICRGSDDVGIRGLAAWVAAAASAADQLLCAGAVFRACHLRHSAAK